MGRVYRAYDNRLDRWVALKQIRPGARRPQIRQRFLREAKILARLDHPALVHIHDILNVQDEDWIVMELVEGQGLDQLLADGPLSVVHAVSMAVEICSGLVAAHSEGIVHRDLKAENIRVQARFRPKILDFGLALGLAPESDGASTTVDAVVGTPRAMSPEQVQQKPVDARSDLFSFGTLLYEMLSGVSPFLGSDAVATMTRVCTHRHEPLADLTDSLPEGLSHLVDRLLAKEPADRPENGEAVELALRRILAGLASVGTPLVRRGAVGETTPAESLASSLDLQAFHLQGEHRQVTVVSSSLSFVQTQMDLFWPALPELQKKIVDLVEQLDGQICDLQGHRWVACFGHPSIVEDHAKRAILAAFETTRHARALDGFEIRTGIHSGDAIIPLERDKSAGSDDRRPFLLGHVLDLGMAIEAEAAPNQIALSRCTKELASKAFGVDAWYREEKGKPEAPVVLLGNPGPLNRVRWENAPDIMVGRDRELRLLLERWRLARDGALQVVTLQGQAGIGKTRLVGALHDQQVGGGDDQAVNEGEVRWLAVRGDSTTEHQALAPIPSLLRQLLRVGENHEGEGLLPTFQRFLERFDVMPQDWEALRPLLESSDGGGKTSLAEERVLLRLLADILLETAESTPKIIVFEDLQWMDTTTLELISLLGDGQSTGRLLMVLTFRPGFQWPWTDRQATHLHLAPLDQEAAEAMIRELVSGRALPDEHLSDLVRRSEGIPLFAVELTRSLCTAPDGGDSIPPVLRSLLAAQLDVPTVSREFIWIAAGLGRCFEIQALCAATGLGRREVEADIEPLLEQDILAPCHEDEGKFCFRYALLYETARDSMLDLDRRRLAHWATPSA